MTVSITNCSLSGAEVAIDCVDGVDGLIVRHLDTDATVAIRADGSVRNTHVHGLVHHPRIVRRTLHMSALGRDLWGGLPAEH